MSYPPIGVVIGSSEGCK